MVNGAQYCAVVGLNGAPCWYDSQCPSNTVGSCKGANVAAGVPGACTATLPDGAPCTSNLQCASGSCNVHLNQQTRVATTTCGSPQGGGCVVS
jgi:hypothetical protein